MSRSQLSDSKNLQGLWKITSQHGLRLERNTASNVNSPVKNKFSKESSTLRQVIRIQNSDVTDLPPSKFWQQVKEQCSKRQISEEQFVVVVAGNLSRDRLHVASVGDCWSCVL